MDGTKSSDHCTSFDPLGGATQPLAKTFTDFHTNSSVCSPTRAAFYTGRYQQRAGIVDVVVGAREPDSGLSADLPTLGKVFQKNGYATGLFGKWHVGFQDEYNPVHHGFDEFIGLLNGAGDYHVEEDWRNGLEPMVMRGYATDRITADSIDFIERHQKEPFFLIVSHQTQHNPDQLDGRSFATHLRELAPVPQRDIFFGYEPKLGTAMRRGPWKMILKDEKVQLYNLEKDLGETNNVASENQEIATSMRAAIKAFKETVVPGS